MFLEDATNGYIITTKHKVKFKHKQPAWFAGISQ